MRTSEIRTSQLALFKVAAILMTIYCEIPSRRDDMAFNGTNEEEDYFESGSGLRAWNRLL
jgi:hypothetical protein